jgi:TonB family protein
VGRNIVWSFILHVVVITAGALVAPMGGLFDATSHPLDVISVGLVDAPNQAPAAKLPKPKINAPTPEASDAVAIKPESDLTKEEVPPEEKPEPLPKEDEKPKEEEKKPEEKPREPEKKPEQKPEQKPAADTVSQLADASTETGMTGSISDGSGSDDIWGVETDASVNPYYRRGFSVIRNNWRNPATGPRPLKCVVRFRVVQSGQIMDVKLEQSSGSALFDRQAVRAVQMTEAWDPFPRFWEENEQVILLDFEYRP